MINKKDGKWNLENWKNRFDKTKEYVSSKYIHMDNTNIVLFRND